MKSIYRYLFAAALGGLAAAAYASPNVVVEMSDYGVRPDTGKDMAPKIEKALSKIKARYGNSDLTIHFAPGRYEFYPEKATQRTYYISNHDQPNPKAVGIALEGWSNLTLDASGATFVFNGRMLPVSLVGSDHCTLSGFAIDFNNPHIAQIHVVESDDNGIVFRPSKEVKWRISPSGAFVSYGRGWELTPRNGIAFEPETGHLVYNTSDLWCPTDSVVRLPNGDLRAPRWRDERLHPGTVVALRTWDRPAPGIFLSESTASSIENVKVHYAEGMGLLAQMCDSVRLDRFAVCRRSDNDSRYFTTQADATHFSGCKGHIESVNGLYEGMMDDAINVHGTYLRIVEAVNDSTLRARYMHPQTYGFKWGETGDTVRFIAPRTMEDIGVTARIAEITPSDMPSVTGAKEFLIRIDRPLPTFALEIENLGIENITWSPSVNFAGNTIRNNRARGSLFSTPRHTEVFDNLFDHTSGTAVLLCGDCNGWFETGACRDVVIKGNRFVNALTNMFQFTEAVISIYPEIPDLDKQTEYFHGGKGFPGIVISDNEFVTFDAPLVYAKSVDGLTITGNKVKTSDDYTPFHRNTYSFRLQHVRNATISDNNFDKPESLSIKVE